MNQQKRKNRFTLTLLLAAIIFIVLLVSSIFAAIAVSILMHFDIIAIPEGIRVMPLLLYMALISLVIGFVIVLFVGKFLLKPVNRMITQMNQLATGNFKVRLEFGKPLDGLRTFNEITESFNKMAEELESTEMLRSDFINNFSHEFKTPIVSIAGFAKLLKKGKLTEKQKAEYINIIEEESLRLADMATNVLNLTRVENQTILTDVTKYNLSEQIRSCILLLEDKWSKKNLEFELEFAEHMIWANEELLKQVWINLLDNAIKFSPDSGVVDLKISDDSDSLTVSITNTGSEISPENQTKIWGKFYQCDESHFSAGNGIGLAIVKRIVELHHGAASVHSENKTTIFTIELQKHG